MKTDAEESPVILNGFEVEPRIAKLMRRPDWQLRRGDRITIRNNPDLEKTKSWFEKFPVHPDATQTTVTFVQFCGVEQAERENENVRKPELEILCGVPCTRFPPGDFDPTAGYIIGFVDYADSAICVDLRPKHGPRIIYESLAPLGAVFLTAFETIEEFVLFYESQHGTLID